ncbi:hypothetical protein OSB04_010021 [Centaurea solstitialis]|uniref:Leucine-rich repeat-containing N-terminal plant-type domain-containing protein n=1 Tax=Centaurea solstitialis TaxID=347529 RepID=A0AA38WCF5_9ASTR|nr:hypothetical protein OSB04_010021 [Centaurea solstitialis]
MNWSYYFIIIILLLFATCLSIASGNQLAEAATTDGNRNGAINDKSCFHKEKQALLHFKASIYQDFYGRLSTWRLEDDDCCKWSGITCNNQTHHVTELHLQAYYLEGEISPSLVNLTYLNHLDLSWNSFNGTILNFIGSMTQLRYLDLQYNYFNGTIPNFIGSMTQLRYLDLSQNSFNGTIPKSIGSLTQLRYLDLSDNFLHGNIPPEFGNLISLRNLSLGTYHERSSMIEIENLDWLSNLSHLQHLQMHGISLAKANYWTDVILSLRKLSYLNLMGCDLSEVMHPYSSFLNSSSSSIEYLYLGKNNLNSSMYRWLFPLTSNRLLFLDLSKNMLDGVSKYLGNLCSLTDLYLESNQIAVKFADFLNNLSGCTSVTLRTLIVPYSQFIGSVSDEIQKFSSLEFLYLSDNHLSGTMSEKVWELPNLQTLFVSSNSLIISPNIGKSRLQTINLSNNSLVVTPSKAHMSNNYYVESIDLRACKVGPLYPKWIQTYKNLTHLDISGNRISNTIPVQFWKTWPSRLRYLNLSSNNISGKLLDLSSNFDIYPTIIDLSSNNFYGSIPNVPSTLASLNLSRNKFNGGISFLCQIVDGFLSFLDLSHNSLTGQLPDCLWHFNGLKVLNLGYNHFSGRLPASVGYLFQLQVLDLYNNSFSEELPLSWKNFTSLTFLNLGANHFSGNVPVWIGENLTWLYGLILRSNNFFGPIPLQLCHLANLQILDLSMNNLNGTIPTCVNNLTVMVDGRLSRKYRHYYGEISKSSYAYVDNAMIEWQGNEREFTNTLGLLLSIDLSSNNLTGQIPNELTNLHGLVALNLSKNTLLGEIPRKIGEMKNLLTLDLSRNNFSGAIPSSMSQMALLNYLDMSHNSLSGRIPSSTQLQSFPPSRYIGNAGLCGLPITESCPGDEAPSTLRESESSEEGIDELERWFYIGGAIGFAVGFWMACGALLLNRHGRHAFFLFVDSVKDWVYVKVVVLFRKLERISGPTAVSSHRHYRFDLKPVRFKPVIRSNRIGSNPLIIAATDGNIGAINKKSCFHKEKQALLHFKASISQDFYGRLSTWRVDDDDCCKWSGITCNNQTHHVTELHISSRYELRGEISPSLVNLTYLSHLDLCANSFDGSIPNFIGFMTKLRYLDLSWNSFNGTIPNFIGSMTQLRYLDLSANSFNGTIPNVHWFLDPIKIAVKFVDFLNNLSGCTLVTLRGLSAWDSQFTGSLSDEIQKFSSLEFLDLSDNRLSGTMSEKVWELPNLQNLDVSSNSLVITANVGKEKISYIDLSNNSLVVVVTPSKEGPIEFGTYVDNAIMEWQENERELTSTLRFLISIDLSGNNLTGQIPKELTDLHELLALNLSKNALLGEIPRKIGEMKKLTCQIISCGRIPSGTQLQSFEPSRYIGNAGLCGPPITRSCPGDEVPSMARESESGEESIDELWRWFYIGGGTGFALGFWMACGVLLLNRRGRHAFFPFVDFVKDWVYVKVVLIIRKLERVVVVSPLIYEFDKRVEKHETWLSTVGYTLEKYRI